MKIRKIIILFFAIVLGYTINAQTKYEKAQQGINTLVSIQETHVGTKLSMDAIKVSLCDLTIVSTGVKYSSVKLESPTKGYVGYIDKAELAGLVNALKKIQKLYTSKENKEMKYVYRLTGDLWFYTTGENYIRVVYENGYTIHYLDAVVNLLESAKNGTPIED